MVKYGDVSDRGRQVDVVELAADKTTPHFQFEVRVEEVGHQAYSSTGARWTGEL
jgi:hypothetical protein